MQHPAVCCRGGAESTPAPIGMELPLSLGWRFKGGSCCGLSQQVALLVGLWHQAAGVSSFHRQHFTLEMLPGTSLDD